MAGTKKRKEPTQTSTLFDYFGASAKKSRCGTPELAPSKRLPDCAPGEIIVISDNDEDNMKTEYQPKLKSVCSDSSRELQSSLTRIPSNFPTEDDSGSHQLCEGLPVHAASESHPGDMDFPFEVNVMKERGSDAYLDPLRYDAWATGDDEDLPQEDEDDDFEEGEVKVELCQGKYEDNDGICPVCEMKLKGLFISEIERHVNRCIDTFSCSTSSYPQHNEIKPLYDVQAPSATLTTPTSKSAKSTAFSVLMSNHMENNVWKEASEAENKKGTRGRRPAPFYKVMQGMPIAVDAFRYGKIPGVTAYFLTHAHSDHYTNLSSSWKHGPIYCSQTTANLIIHMLDVNPAFVFPLPLNLPTVVPNTGGVEVTLIQANHCPGSVLFLFKGQQTVNAGDSTFTSPYVGSPRVFRYLHCGDFRACPRHVLHGEIKGKRIDVVYLDTTYLDPKYCFPPQPLVISACAELARRIVQAGGNTSGLAASSDEKSVRGKSVLTDWVAPKKGGERANGNGQPERVLVVVGTYTIGKERIVKAIARTLSTKVYCDPRKTAILKCVSDPELHELLTPDPREADVHIVPLHVISSDRLKEYLSKWNGRWTKAVGFRPTGWTYAPPGGTDTLPNLTHIISRDQARTFTYANLRPMRNSTPTFMLYGVPYSEHSSFFELTCFALSLDWGKMIATVNVGSAKSREKMARWFEKWQAERTKRLKPGGLQDVVQYRQLDHW